MNNADKLLQVVIAEANAIKIPISLSICPSVVINRRATARFGSCTKKGDLYIIEISDRLLEAPEESCRQTLAHEILHTCFGCKNHGPRWKTYAAAMNTGYGYTISRTGTYEQLGMINAKPVRYTLRCQLCGVEITRTRSSNLTKHPERYRCRCGGKLKLLG